MASHFVSLPTGQQMPIIGYGTWLASESELEAALENALEAGYRHIDAAPVYENEHTIGKVLKRWIDSGRIKRSELFIVTKLPPIGHRPGGVEKWIKKSLKDLQLDYLDLYLVHTPFAFQETDNEDLHPKNENGEILQDTSTDHLRVWSEMEKQVEKGYTRAIGLSNFNINQINRIIPHAKLPISNLQIELHAYFQQKELTEFCRNHNITVTAYSPLGSRGLVKLMGKTDNIPDILEDPTVVDLTKKYKKTAAQILLKYIIQNNIAAIPKSTNPQRMKENIQLFDWKLEAKDMEKLSVLDLGPSARINNFSFLKGIQTHPEYPFETSL